MRCPARRPFPLIFPPGALGPVEGAAVSASIGFRDRAPLGAGTVQQRKPPNRSG
jgi:hypothetical protein